MNSSYSPSMYLCSVLLEKNRWSSRVPSFKVSDWSTRIAEAGFDGIELWENHLLLADDPAEREAVRSGPAPVTVLNTYCSFDEQGAESRAASAELARFLKVPAVKFNLGGDPAKEEMYLENLKSWRSALPAGCRLLCECHPGTILEEVTEAKRILASTGEPVEIIVHAFGDTEDAPLRRWLEAFEEAVTHVHAVIKERSVLAPRVALLKEFGFTGTFSIEFCRGVASPPEDMNQLLDTAAEDMRLLRATLNDAAY